MYTGTVKKGTHSVSAVPVSDADRESWGTFSPLTWSAGAILLTTLYIKFYL